MRWYYNITNFIAQIKKFFIWGWHMRKDVDWDANSVWKVLAIKYRRTYDHMLKHSHLDWNSCPTKQGMRKLQTMAHLAERIQNEEAYETPDGLMCEHSFVELPCGNFMLDSHWEPGQKEKWLRETKRLARMKQNDIELFAKLLAKNNASFWD
jgi:hypothetical protein